MSLNIGYLLNARNLSRIVEINTTTSGDVILMRKNVKILLLALILLLSLAACSDSKEPEKDNEIETPVSEKPSEKVEEDEKPESNTESSIEGDNSIGATAEEFKERFNEHVSNNNLEFTIDDYEWVDYQSNAQLASFEFDEDITLTAALENESSEELKTVLLEVSGHDSRELVFNVIETVIEATNPSLTADDLQEIMTELGLTDSAQDGKNEELMYVQGGLKYLLNDEEGNWLEFLVANENDTDFELE